MLIAVCSVVITMSVILQVGCFKLSTASGIFEMAPLPTPLDSRAGGVTIVGAGTGDHRALRGGGPGHVLR
ncbi:hypothetical protein QJS66_05555 [Kocuria rhizophila]|nr:hypothetical protein QJS66_05555 [Kocuria rhizophila]